MNAAQKNRRNASRSERRLAAAKRRQQLAARSGRAQQAVVVQRSRRGRTVAIVGVAAVFVLAAGIVAFALRDDDAPDTSLRASVIAKNAPEQTITGLPVAYRVTYRIETESQDLVQEITIRRPYDSRYRVGDAGQIETPIIDLVATAANHTQRSQGQADEAEMATATLPAFSSRFDAMIGDLVTNGFYERRDRRTLLGQECTVYRTGATIEGTEVTKVTDTTHADLCITDDGIVLEEVSVTGGAVDLRVTATDIRRDLSLTDADFPVIDDATVLAAGGVVVGDVSASTPPTSPYWQWSTAPDGWTNVARQTMAVTKPDQSIDGPTATKTSWVDVYTRGADLVIVRQGVIGNEPAEVDTTNGIDVTVGDLGPATLALSTYGSKIIVSDKGGRFVQVFGTVPVAELTALASALKVVSAAS